MGTTFSKPLNGTTNDTTTTLRPDFHRYGGSFVKYFGTVKVVTIVDESTMRTFVYDKDENAVYQNSLQESENGEYSHQLPNYWMYAAIALGVFLLLVLIGFGCLIVWSLARRQQVQQPTSESENGALMTRRSKEAREGKVKIKREKNDVPSDMAAPLNENLSNSRL